MIQNPSSYKPSTAPVSSFLPLDDASTEDAFKTPNSAPDDTNDSSRLSYEMEMSDASSSALDQSSSKI